MIWHEHTLLGHVRTGEDALQNPLYQTVELFHFLGTPTPWTLEEKEAMGREFTATRRKLLGRIPVQDLEGLFAPLGELHIRLEGTKYSVENIANMGGRYCMFFLYAAHV